MKINAPVFAALFTAIVLLIPGHSAAAKNTKKSVEKLPPFSSSPAVQDFIREMHAAHGFDVTHLSRQFARVHSNASVLRAIRPAAVPELQRSWQRYRGRFLNERRLSGGLAFWQENGAELVRAEAIYGVPPEIITAIIGVETEYGGNTGRFSVLEALSTLAFDYPPRAPFFRKELEEFLLMTRENGVSPLDIQGSYAGAIGIPQFMPSSQRNYAVDFDGDDRIDLRGSTSDAIGSVARYLKLHGWLPGEPIAASAHVVGDPGELLAAGIEPTLSLAELTQQGVQVDGGIDLPGALIDLVSPEQATEYWVGYRNFYVITRYNRSSFYAMSVFQLAEALREAHAARPSLN